MNTAIKKSLVAGAVAIGIAVPSLMYNIQKDYNADILQVVEQQHRQLEHQQQEVKSLHKEIDQQKKEINAVNKQNKELKGKNQDLEGFRNLVLDNVGYIPSR